MTPILNTGVSNSIAWKGRIEKENVTMVHSLKSKLLLGRIL